jgi:hypothetical protein
MSALDGIIRIGKRHDIQEGYLIYTDLGFRVYWALMRWGIFYDWNRDCGPPRWWQLR